MLRAFYTIFNNLAILSSIVNFVMNSSIGPIISKNNHATRNIINNMAKATAMATIGIIIATNSDIVNKKKDAL